MSQRVLRVRELIQRELGGMLQREIDFGGVLVSIHDVDITPDFRHCHVYYGVIGQARDERSVQEKLDKHRGAFQAKLAKRVVLKNTPRLHFKLDHSVERGVRVLRAIEDLPPPADPDPEDACPENPVPESNTGPDHPVPGSGAAAASENSPTP